MEQKTNIKSFSLLLGLILFLGVIGFIVSRPAVKTITAGSVTQGSEYHATTTLGVAQTHTDVIDAFPGTLGSVVITTAGTGSLTIYDAARSGDINATNTLMTIPASLVAGTYTADAIATHGLVFVYASFAPVATITYR